MEENADKLHFKCTDFNCSTRVTVDKITESLIVGTFLRHSVVVVSRARRKSRLRGIHGNGEFWCLPWFAV